MERKHLHRKERVTDRVTERERDTEGQRGRAPQPGRICPSLPALVRSQREAGTLKSVAFSDTQVWLVTGRKGTTKCISASLSGLWLPPANYGDG